MATKKPKQFKFNVDNKEYRLKEAQTEDYQMKFLETYKIKEVSSSVPTYIPKNEQECYVRYVSGVTYKLYVYLGSTVGWKSITLS